MARDRDGQDVAARTRAQGEALLKAWQDYRDKAAALGAIVQCQAIYLIEGDHGVQLGVVTCDLVEGHPAGVDDGGHRHRMLGSQVVVTW